MVATLKMFGEEKYEEVYQKFKEKYESIITSGAEKLAMKVKPMSDETLKPVMAFLLRVAEDGFDKELANSFLSEFGLGEKEFELHLKTLEVMRLSHGAVMDNETLMGLMALEMTIGIAIGVLFSALLIDSVREVEENEDRA